MKSADFQLAQMTKKREDLLFFGPSKFLLNISLDLSVLIMCFRKLCVEAGRAPKKIVFCLQILMFNGTEENPQKSLQTQHTPLKSCEKCHDSRIILHGIFMQQFHKVQTTCWALFIFLALNFESIFTVFRKFKDVASFRFQLDSKNRLRSSQTAIQECSKTVSRRSTLRRK